MACTSNVSVVSPLPQCFLTPLASPQLSRLLCDAGQLVRPETAGMAALVPRVSCAQSGYGLGGLTKQLQNQVSRNCKAAAQVAGTLGTPSSGFCVRQIAERLEIRNVELFIAVAGLFLKIQLLYIPWTVRSSVKRMLLHNSASRLAFKAGAWVGRDWLHISSRNPKGCRNSRAEKTSAH